MVYFITDGEFFKIGFAKNPNQRLVQLQTGNPNKLTLFKTIHGGYFVEKWFHDELAKYNYNNEWFNLDDMELLKKIEEFKLNKNRILADKINVKQNDLFNIILNKTTGEAKKKIMGELIHKGALLASESIYENLQISKPIVLKHTNNVNIMQTLNKYIEPRTLLFLEDENNKRHFKTQESVNKFLKFLEIYDPKNSLDTYTKELGISKTSAVEFKKLLNK